MPYESDEEPTGSPKSRTATAVDATAKATSTDDANDLSASSDGDNTVPDSCQTNVDPQRPLSADASTKTKGTKTKGKRVDKNTARHMAMMNRYRDLELGNSLWDYDIKYLQIGKHGEFDTVFIVSAVNCHMSLMRMRVHGDYMRWLEKGIPAPVCDLEEIDDERELRRDTLYVDRSRWLNFLVEEDRVEALTGVWRIMSWLLRPTEEQGKNADE